jgi:hypothetical protein
LFAPGLVEWQGAQWAKTFSTAVTSPSACAASVPLHGSIIEQIATGIPLTVPIATLGFRRLR